MGTLVSKQAFQPTSQLAPHSAPQQKSKFQATLLTLISIIMVFTMIIPVGSGRAFAGEQTVTLIANHEIWKYADTNTDLFGNGNTDFRSASYDDTAWKTGASPLGYPVAETSNYFGPISSGGTLMDQGAQGASSSSASVTYYLRKDFTVDNIADIVSLTAKIAIDDGYVLYLNGNEISRVNIPAGQVGHTTEAPDDWEATEERANITIDLSAYRQYLVEGANTLAASVHNRDASSSDIYWSLTLTAGYNASALSALSADVDKTPKQVNVHVGNDPSRSVNVTYTTIKSDTTKIVLTKANGSGTALTFTGESSIGSGNKYIHKIPVTGLEANTDYNYIVGNEVTFDGSFKTAPAAGSQDSIRFVYLADTQVSNAANAKALGATLEEVANMDPDFVYLAGDVTDTSTNETQWEQLFYNDGSYPNGGQNMFGNYLIAAAQGNHDNNTFNRHINAPTLTSNAIENRIVYSYDYGPVTFIILNLEAAGSDATARSEQEQFLRAAVADAQARGQWTAVGFHKSLITGASHVTDSDIVEARKFWIPKFAELDVDMVLQGHDHVYSRGFVDATGYAASKTVNADGTINEPSNAPLYMIGGHAGGLKWYALKNYTVAPGDPLAPGYSYLDIDSANPADNADGVSSDVKQEQVIVELEVSPTTVTVNSWMFKYNTNSDTITTQKYLYDTMTMVRKVPAAATPVTASIAGPDLAVAEQNELITYTVSYSNLVNANTFDTALTYDAQVLEFVEAKSLFSANNLLVNAVQAANNQVRIITGLASVIGQAATQDVVQFTFRAKQPVKVDDTTVSLIKANTVTRADAASSFTDVIANKTVADKTTVLYTYRKAADINKDGSVTLADLALALEHYQSTAAGDRIYDINLSGVVDALDFVIICSFIE